MKIWACNFKQFPKYCIVKISRMSWKTAKLRQKMTFYVHKMTSRLARTLKIGAGKVFCMRNPKITFKISKKHLFLSYSTCLPKFGYRMTKPQKGLWHCSKMNFFFSVSSVQFEICLIQEWSFVLFPLLHNLTSKTDIFSLRDETRPFGLAVSTGG